MNLNNKIKNKNLPWLSKTFFPEWIYFFIGFSPLLLIFCRTNTLPIYDLKKCIIVFTLYSLFIVMLFMVAGKTYEFHSSFLLIKPRFLFKDRKKIILYEEIKYIEYVPLVKTSSRLVIKYKNNKKESIPIVTQKKTIRVVNYLKKHNYNHIIYGEHIRLIMKLFKVS